MFMLTPQKLEQLCMEQSGATKDYPFGPEPLVIKVVGKMFALISENKQDGLAHISLKCDPHTAEFLRMQYKSVIPGYHLNKKHWNTVIVDGTIPETEIQEMIEHSYKLVVRSLTKAQRAELETD